MTDELKTEPGRPTETTDEAETIRKAVEERKKAEAASYPDTSRNNGKVHSAFVKECLKANELGDGLLYTSLCKGRFIFNVSSREWYAWTEHFWSRDVHDQSLAAVEDVVARLLEETTETSKLIDIAIKEDDKDQKARLESKRDFIYKRISRLRTDRGRTACLKFARSCRDPLTIEGTEFDIKPWLLACANGVIDLETGKFRPGRQSDNLSMASPVEWKGLDEPAKGWEKFLLTVFMEDEEMVTYIHRLLGYAITGLTTEHIMAVLYGKGWNGKGTLVETLIHVLGSMAKSIQPEMLLSEWKPKSSATPSPDIMALKGLRIAFASETDEGRAFSSAKVKRLTGGDELPGRNPYDKYEVRFKPSHTLFLMTNNKPGVSGGDDFAFWERMHLIPFKLSFVTREPTSPNERPAIKGLSDQLKKEASGILAWLVRGCLDYQKNGLPLPQAVIDATLEYREDEDNLGQFIAGFCKLDPYAKSQSSDLFDKFDSWFKKYISSKGISHKRFGQMMNKKFERRKITGVNYYVGVEIDPEKAKELGGED